MKNTGVNKNVAKKKTTTKSNTKSNKKVAPKKNLAKSSMKKKSYKVKTPSAVSGVRG